jgi:isoquinoline 1-oxidoreductase subunit beta
VKLKDSAAWTLIGKEAHRRNDSLVKTNGQEQFTIDVKFDGLLTAVPIHPPLFGATVKKF